MVFSVRPLSGKECFLRESEGAKAAPSLPSEPSLGRDAGALSVRTCRAPRPA